MKKAALRADLRLQARRIVADPSRAVPPRVAGCAAPSGRGLTSVITVDGTHVVVRIDRSARSAAVFDCATARHELLTIRF